MFRRKCTKQPCFVSMSSQTPTTTSLWSAGERGTISFSAAKQDKLCHHGLPAMNNWHFGGFLTHNSSFFFFLQVTFSLSLSLLLIFSLFLPPTHAVWYQPPPPKFPKRLLLFFSPLTDEWLLCTFKLACLLLIVASLFSFTYQAARPQALCSSLKFRNQAIYY